jgi:uncharacterized protein
MSGMKHDANGIQRRALPAAGVEVRAAEDGKRTLSGYAAVFYRADDPGTEFTLYEGRVEKFVERVMPGAFDAALKEDDVRALVNHNVEMILGRTKAGTLALSVDAKGLRYECEIPDTQAGRDLAESVKRGDITGSSFAFQLRNGGATYREGGGLYVREITDVKLYDVGPVTYPAYDSSEASVRSREQWEAEWRADSPPPDESPARPELDEIELLISSAA